MADWRKSSRSQNNHTSDFCVEMASLPAGIGVRDSKNKEGGVLTFSVPEMRAFINYIKRHW